VGLHACNKLRTEWLKYTNKFFVLVFNLCSGINDVQLSSSYLNDWKLRNSHSEHSASQFTDMESVVRKWNHLKKETHLRYFYCEIFELFDIGPTDIQRESKSFIIIPIWIERFIMSVSWDSQLHTKHIQTRMHNWTSLSVQCEAKHSLETRMQSRGRLSSKKHSSNAPLFPTSFLRPYVISQHSYKFLFFYSRLSWKNYRWLK
jgi:hypothetical protein